MMETNFDNLKALRTEALRCGAGSKAWIDFANTVIDSFPQIYDTAKQMNAEALRLHYADTAALNLDAALRDKNVSDEALKDILIELYKAGLCDGHDKANGLVAQITQDMTQIVVAFLARDGAALAKAVGEFVDRRVIINVVGGDGAGATTRH